MDDPEVTLQEQIFHNAVREHIVSADWTVQCGVYACAICVRLSVTLTVGPVTLTVH